MMTRKDYVATAEILKLMAKPYIQDSLDYEDLVDEFADMFANDNENFKTETFRKACDLV